MNIPTSKNALYVYGAIALILAYVLYRMWPDDDKDNRPKTKKSPDLVKVSTKADTDEPITNVAASVIYGPDKINGLNDWRAYVDNSDLFKANGLQKAGIDRDKDQQFIESATYIHDELNATNIDEDGVANSLQVLADGDWGAFNLLYVSDLYYRLFGKTLADDLNDTTLGALNIDIHDYTKFLRALLTAQDSKSYKMLVDKGLKI